MVRINQCFFRTTQFAFTLIVLTFVFALSGIKATAQCPGSTFVNGLQGPSKIIQTPLGNLLVAEFGTETPNTGRISIISEGGTRRTLLDGLPSGINDVGDVVGITGLYLRGRTLYITTGQGDATLAGPFPGTEIANPNPSSPIYNSVLAIHFSAAVENTITGFTLSSANQQALANGQELNFGKKGGGVRVELIANLPDYVSAPLPSFPSNVRHSNLYGLTGIGNRLYVVDAGLNAVHEIEIGTGESSILTVFPPIPNPLPFGPPVIEAVPTNIRVYGNQLLVTLLRGFPFPPNTAQVMAVNPQTGTSSPFISGLTSAIDVLPHNGGFLTLEISTNLLTGQPGRLQYWSSPAGPPTVISNCLIGPSSMVYDQRTGTLFVTEIFTGRIIQIPLG